MSLRSTQQHSLTRLSLHVSSIIKHFVHLSVSLISSYQQAWYCQLTNTMPMIIIIFNVVATDSSTWMSKNDLFIRDTKQNGRRGGAHQRGLTILKFPWDHRKLENEYISVHGHHVGGRVSNRRELHKVRTIKVAICLKCLNLVHCWSRASRTLTENWKTDEFKYHLSQLWKGCCFQTRA